MGSAMVQWATSAAALTSSCCCGPKKCQSAHHYNYDASSSRCCNYRPYRASSVSVCVRARVCVCLRAYASALHDGADMLALWLWVYGVVRELLVSLVGTVPATLEKARAQDTKGFGLMV